MVPVLVPVPVHPFLQLLFQLEALKALRQIPGRRPGIQEDQWRAPLRRCR